MGGKKNKSGKLSYQISRHIELYSNLNSVIWQRKRHIDQNLEINSRTCDIWLFPDVAILKRTHKR